MADHKKPRRKSKYNSRKVVVDSETFDSRAEATRYGVLKIAQRGGLIMDLRCHPRVPLYACDANGENVTKVGHYEADFCYRTAQEPEELIYEDVKGVETGIFRLKKKMVEVPHGINIHLVKIKDVRKLKWLSST